MVVSPTEIFLYIDGLVWKHLDDIAPERMDRGTSMYGNDVILDFWCLISIIILFEQLLPLPLHIGPIAPLPLLLKSQKYLFGLPKPFEEQISILGHIKRLIVR